MELLLNLLLREFARPGILGLCQGVAKCIAALRTSLFQQEDSSQLDMYWTVFLYKICIARFSGAYSFSILSQTLLQDKF